MNTKKNQSVVKILHLSYDSIYNKFLNGGGAKRIDEIYKNLPNNVSIKVLTARGDKCNDKKYKFVGTSYSKYDNRISYFIFSLIYLIFNSWKYDLIVESYSVYNPLFSFVFKKKQVSMFQNLISISDKEKKGLSKRLMSYLDKFYIFMSKKIITDGDAVRNYIKKDYNRDINVIRNGFDKKYLDYKIDNTIKRKILFIGRLAIYQKGLDKLAKINEKIRLKDVSLIIAGDSKEINDVKKLFEHSKRKVIFLGNVRGKNKIDSIRNSDLVILTSRYESSPTIIGEVNSLGKPVFALKSWGVNESIKDGINGFLCSSESELSQKIEDYFKKNINQRKQISVNCRKYAEGFSWEKCAKETLKVYMEVLKEK